MGVRVPLFRPKEYFEHSETALSAGLVIFVVYVASTLTLFYLGMSLLLDQIQNSPAALESAFMDVFFLISIVTVVIAVVALLLVAAIMHYLSGGGKTDGTFGAAVAVAGWAYAPNVLMAPFDYLIIRREVGRLTLDASDPALLRTKLEAAADPTGLLSILTMTVAIAWSVYILAEGTAGTHGIDVGKTIGPALIVGAGAFVMMFL